MVDRNDKNPTNTVGRLNKQREDVEKIGELCSEGREAYRKAINGVAASPNGKIFLQTLIKAIHVFDPITAKDNIALIECNAQKNVYLKYIRPYLEPDVKKELEN